MAYRRLWVLIEGTDDEIFFEQVVKPEIEARYDFIGFWQYAQEPRKRTQDFLRSITSMNANYFLLADINDLPCLTAKKDWIQSRYGKAIHVTRAIIVVPEIESWYLAGLNEEACTELGIQTSTDTDEMTKEKFNNLIPKTFDSRIDFMVEVLKRFSIKTAVRKNRSFDYFARRVGLV